MSVLVFAQNGLILVNVCSCVRTERSSNVDVCFAIVTLKNLGASRRQYGPINSARSLNVDVWLAIVTLNILGASRR